MNKYLFDKLQNAKSAYFNNIIFLANECLQEQNSEAFEDFLNLKPIEIAKVFGFKKDKPTLSLIEKDIEEDEIKSVLVQNGKFGFLAQCYLPYHSNFSFSEGEERPDSSFCSRGHSRVVWLYAESIGELVEKLQEAAEAFYVECYEKEKSTPKNTKK